MNLAQQNSEQEKINVEEGKKWLQESLLSSLATNRRMASAIGIPKSKVHRNVEGLAIGMFSRSMKPVLSGENNKNKLNWRALQNGSLNRHGLVRFRDVKDSSR